MQIRQILCKQYFARNRPYSHQIKFRLCTSGNPKNPSQTKEKPNDFSLGLTQRERFELSVGY